jgi:hypothetical protein
MQPHVKFQKEAAAKKRRRDVLRSTAGGIAPAVDLAQDPCQYGTITASTTTPVTLLISRMSWPTST